MRAYAEQVGSYAQLVVEDSGVGIPPDHLPHIFDRFYRVPDPNPEKGLGLGLSFVSAIVKAHGGEIRVNSRLGQGSRFEVTLPAGPTREVPEPLTISAQSLERFVQYPGEPQASFCKLVSYHWLHVIDIQGIDHEP